MKQGIQKLDETMQDDIEAFTAAINRDIDGDNSDSQLSDDSSTAVSQGINHKKGSQNQPAKNDSLRDLSLPTSQHKQFQDNFQKQQAEWNSLQMSQTTSVQSTEKTSGHLQESDRLQRMSNQQEMAAGRAPKTIIHGGKLLPFGLLLPIIKPQLDNDRAMQLQALYIQLKQNTISKEAFFQRVRRLVGDHIVKMSVYKLVGQAARNSRKAANQMATANSSHISSSVAQFSADHPCIGANQIGTTTQAMNQMIVPKIERHDSLSDVNRVQGGTLTQLTNNLASQTSSGLSVYKEQNHLSYVKLEPIDETMEQPQKSQFSTSQGLSSFPPGQHELGNNSGASKDESYESSKMGFSISNSKSLSIITKLKSGQHDPPLSITAQMECERHNPQQFITSQVERECHNLTLSITAQLERERHTQPMSITAQLEYERQNSLSSQIPSTASPLGLGSSGKTIPQKPSIGQKKPLEELGSSQPPSSKKQKLSGALSDQDINELNDVTAVSGVNLREEAELLFSGSKEESRASEASRMVVQEEEERLILQKIPLQKKLAEIMAKCGVMGMSNDVERCLSLCVEERIRGLIGNLIRLSKQRVDLEKPSHQTIVTSDIREQIMRMNQKAQEEWEKKQADAEKLLRSDESEDDTGADGDNEKDEGRGKSFKANKEEDDKMRTRAANVAARAAMGGDDMMSRWQLMADLARMKNKDSASNFQSSVDVESRTLSNSVKSAKDRRDADKRSPSPVSYTPGTVKKFRKSHDVSPTRKARTISVKDVMSVLEREPQMSKKSIVYSLYAKLRSDLIFD